MPTGIYKRKLKSIIKVGDKYNKLTAIKFSHRDKNKKQHWLFKCDCGIEKVICVGSVKNGQTKSCGCIFYHGMYGTKTYSSWFSMKSRCLNPNATGYKNYGGRGIVICKRWLKFENFYQDMGNRPEDKTLDRKNNNGNYNKSNCRWSSRIEQENNKTSNHLLTYQGKTKTIADWARELDIRYLTLWFRIRNGWSIEKAFNYKR